MWLINSGITNPLKSEVIGRCGGDEKNEWPRTTAKQNISDRVDKSIPFVCYMITYMCAVEKKTSRLL